MIAALLEAAALGTAGTLGVAGLLAAFGTRPRPAPMQAFNAAFQQADWAQAGPVPPLQTVPARDGTLLAWRHHAAAVPPLRTVILVHGSSADSRALHLLAHRLAQRGSACIAIDVRGHGGTGQRGDIGHVGQLEEDLADLVTHLRQRGQVHGPLLLLGHSSGGGFALRVAGGPQGALFDGYVLAAPMVHHAPPLARAGIGGWAVPFIPRIVGLTILHRFGLRFWEHLPVIAFAVPEGDDTRTATYSFRLQRNFRPRMSWRADARAVQRPLRILIGANDEMFDGTAYPAAFAGLNAKIAVQVLPDLPHAQWYLAPAAAEALHQALLDVAG